MRIRLLADRTYRRTEHIRWRGKRVGIVVGFEDPLDLPSYAIVEVSDRTLKDMGRAQATRFILERGNLVEVYERGTG